MDEQAKGMSVTKTYSITLKHVGMVADLAERFKVSQGAVVREAIEVLFEAAQAGMVQAVGDALEKVEPVTETN